MFILLMLVQVFLLYTHFGPNALSDGRYEQSHRKLVTKRVRVRVSIVEGPESALVLAFFIRIPNFSLSLIFLLLFGFGLQGILNLFLNIDDVTISENQRIIVKSLNPY